MTDDPIVAEVRAIRDKLAAECNYDVDKIVRRIRQREAESGREYVSHPPRRVTPRIDAAGGLTTIGGVTMELETITKVPVEQLRLDRESPRLAGEAAEASDAWIVARLHRSIGLEERLLSFSANGYLDSEPLVVVAGHDGDERGLGVLEDYEYPYEDSCPDRVLAVDDNEEFLDHVVRHRVVAGIRGGSAGPEGRDPASTRGRRSAATSRAVSTAPSAAGSAARPSTRRRRGDEGFRV